MTLRTESSKEFCYRFELSSKMREACLILKNHLNDDIKTLKSKEVVRSCMLLYPWFACEALSLATSLE